MLQHLIFPPIFINQNHLKTALKGKTILITGASFGIGEALVNLLKDTETHLILVARTEAKLLEIQQEMQGNTTKITIFAVDLTQTEAVAQLLCDLQNLPEGIDIIVSNAGKSIRRSIFEAQNRLHDFTRTMTLNYTAPVQLVLGLLPILIQKKGQIINISAANVLLLPAPFWAAYQASKTAFDQFLRCIQPEIAAKNIATTSIYLPLVRTRMIAPTTIYAQTPAMSAERAAIIIAKTMLSRQHTYKPYWLFFGEIVSLFFRTIGTFFFKNYLKHKK
jgi:short-subunit dehydrogenase